MKKFSLLLSLFASASVFACNPEAQFVGTVTKLNYVSATAEKGEYYSFQVKLGHNGHYLFLPSGVCPLMEPELESTVITVPGKPYIANGDFVSGVMVLDRETGENYILE